MKTPRRSSIVTVSCPPPAFTTIAVKRERRKENSTVPFAPTSTWSVPAAFLFSLSASLSPFALPVSVSVPPATFAL